MKKLLQKFLLGVSFIRSFRRSLRSRLHSLVQVGLFVAIFFAAAKPPPKRIFTSIPHAGILLSMSIYLSKLPLGFLLKKPNQNQQKIISGFSLMFAQADANTFVPEYLKK